MSTFSSPYTKPLIVTGISVAIDMLIFKQTNLKNSVFYGVSNGVASFSSNMLINSGMIPNLSTSSPADPNKMYNTFTLEERVLEIGLSVAGGYGVNKYVLDNDGANHDILKKVMTIVAIDIIAEYANDYLNLKPLSYLV